MTAGINLAGQTPGLRLGMSTSLPVGVPGLGGSPRLQMVSPQQQQQQQQQVRILQQQQQQQQVRLLTDPGRGGGRGWCAFDKERDQR